MIRRYAIVLLAALVLFIATPVFAAPAGPLDATISCLIWGRDMGFDYAMVLDLLPMPGGVPQYTSEPAWVILTAYLGTAEGTSFRLDLACIVDIMSGRIVTLVGGDLPWLPHPNGGKRRDF